MTDEPEFLRRWSRRKQAARKPTPPEAAPAADPPAPDVEGGMAASEDAPSGRADSQNADPEAQDLPDIDSLNAESDFKPFLKDGVPEELKNRALRKLWRVNPVFGQLDGLNDYDGDFTDAASVVKDLKTLYKVGRGFLAEPKADPAGSGPEDPKAEDPQQVSEPMGDEDEAGSGDAQGDDQDGNKIS